MNIKVEGAVPLLTKSPAIQPKPKVSFQEMHERMKPASDPFNELKSFERRAMQGAQFSPAELLSFQVKASELHFRVELGSKVAESFSSTVKRLQSGH
jgi:hypothetical protein